MNDPTEAARRERLAEINNEAGSREALERQHGQVWTTDPGWLFTPPGYVSRDRAILLEREFVKLERELGLR